jgi:hypothetical protein
MVVIPTPKVAGPDYRTEQLMKINDATAGWARGLGAGGRDKRRGDRGARVTIKHAFKCAP